MLPRASFLAVAAVCFVLKKTSDRPQRVGRLDDGPEADRAGRLSIRPFLSEDLRTARALEKLFKERGLDVRQEAHWNYLRAITADLFSRRRRKRGRPKGSREWTSGKLAALGLHWERILIERVGPTRGRLWSLCGGSCPVKLKECVRLIRERFPDKYEGISDRAIRRQLHTALRHRQQLELENLRWQAARDRERERYGDPDGDPECELS
jgi:hypothetical protein